MHGYIEALTAAGLHVTDYETFGSYQGQWMARVVTPAGMIGYVHDWYGSCSVCDAFESEFSYSNPSKKALAEFGRRYEVMPPEFYHAWARKVQREIKDQDGYVWDEELDRYKWFIAIEEKYA